MNADCSLEMLVVSDCYWA